MRTSPLAINIMLMCYATADPETNVGANIWNSPAGKEVRTLLRESGLINDKHEATELGKFWCEQICSTPLPEWKLVPGERAA